MGSLILALRFLTIIPVPGQESAGPSALGRAAWWFPVVGLLLGIGLAIVGRAADALFPPLVAAALVVTGWKAVTGGIHLDGLADCLDGLAGRDPARRLAIMRAADRRVRRRRFILLCLPSPRSPRSPASPASAPSCWPR
jgi:adenosylcobinamide-GDP ribazoletransferase